MTQTAEIGAQLAQGRLNDEMLDRMRSLIGTELRTDGCVNNEEVTRMAITRFAEGIGDPNPLWFDEEYAAGTKHGGIDRATELHVRLSRLGAVRLARARRLPLRDQHDVPQAHPPRRRDHGQGLLRRVRRPVGEQVRRPPDQGLPPPGVLQPRRRAGRRVPPEPHPVRALREPSPAPSSARSSCRIRGRPRSWRRSRRTSSPRRRAAPSRVGGRTSRSGTRSGRSPRARSG